jgi:hypothetical protein
MMDSNGVAEVPNRAMGQRSPREVDERTFTGGLTLNIRLLTCTSASSMGTVTQFRLFWDLPLLGLIRTAFGGTFTRTRRFGKSMERCGSCSRPVRCGRNRSSAMILDSSVFLTTRRVASSRKKSAYSVTICRERCLDHREFRTV